MTASRSEMKAEIHDLRQQRKHLILRLWGWRTLAFGGIACAVLAWII